MPFAWKMNEFCGINARKLFFPIWGGGGGHAPLPSVSYAYTPMGPSARLKIFSTAVLTLNFDLDLLKVDSNIWRRCWNTMG